MVFEVAVTERLATLERGYETLTRRVDALAGVQPISIAASPARTAAPSDDSVLLEREEGDESDSGMSTD